MAKRKTVQNVLMRDLTSAGWADYELLDSGHRQKLERFGDIRLVRFESAANWKPAMKSSEWRSADAKFILENGKAEGRWERIAGMPDTWTITLDHLRIHLFNKKSMHVGLFPEQLPNWRWVENKAAERNGEANILNLFAYTGVSTAYASKAGASVTHVDASRSAVDAARRNLSASGLEDRAVRWIVDDAFKFVERENRRGNCYDAIIMDPPKFGRGPGGEVWKFESAIEDFVGACVQLLSQKPLFCIITAYHVDVQPLTLGKLLNDKLGHFHGFSQCGQLVQQEKSAGRKLTQAIYARWEKT